MAENLGTLEYLLKINSEQAEKDLKNIEKLVIEQSKRIQNVFDKYGSTLSKEGFEKLEKKLADLKTKYRDALEAKGAESKGAKKLLTEIVKIEEALSKVNEAYKAQASAAKAAEKATEAQAKWAEKLKLGASRITSARDLETPGGIEYLKKQIEYLKYLRANAPTKESAGVVSQQIKEQEQALKSLIKAQVEQENQKKASASLDKQRSQALIKQYSDQQRAIESLSKQRSKAFVAEQNKLLNEQQKAAETAFARQKLQGAIDTAGTALAKARAQMALYVFELKNVSRTSPTAEADIRRLNAAINEQRNVIAQLRPTEGLWGKLRSAIVSYATAYLSVQGAIAAGRAFFQQTKELDQLSFAMGTVIKNSAELAQTQEFLSDVASNYGGDLLTLSERYIKFRAAAMQSNMTASETQKIFDTVSKAAGTLGLKTDELSGVYLALEQMISKGKVTTEELRRQLGERLPGAFGIMANALGVTLPQLDKMLKKGEVLSKDALPKFAAALEKAYGIESLKKIDTLAAAQGRLSTEVTGLIKSFESSDKFKNVFNDLASFVKVLRENIGTVSTILGIIFKLGTAFLAYKTVLMVIVPLQKAWAFALLVTSKQTRLLATDTIRAAVAAARFATTWKYIGTILKANWIGILITGLTALWAAMSLGKEKAKEMADAMSQLAEEEADILSTLSRVKKVLNDSSTGVNQYKNALQDLNSIAIKYNQELLTEKSSQEDVNNTIEKAITLTDELYLAKRKVVELNKAEESKEAGISPLREALFAYNKEFKISTKTTIDEFNALLDAMETGASPLGKISENTFYKFFNSDLYNQAKKALKEYNDEIARIEAIYPDTKKTSEVVDLEELRKNIDEAAAEFDKLEKVKKGGREKLVDAKYTTDFETELLYLESLKKKYEALGEKGSAALELIAERIGEIKEKGKEPRGGKDWSELQIEKLEAQAKIVEDLKKKYDSFVELFGAENAGKQLKEKFGEVADMAGLIDFDFNLTDEKFIAWGNEFIEKAEAIGGEAGKKQAKSMAEALANFLSERALDKQRKLLDKFQQDLDEFEEKNKLREDIFGITGDEELAIKLSFNTDAIIDAEQFVKNEIVKLANELGQAPLFEGTYESLIANIDKFTPELRKKIESVQQYLAERQENMLLKSLEFLYKNVPEGQDIEFDFSKVITDFNAALSEIKKNVKTFADSTVPAALGLDEKDIERLKQLHINAANEVAKNAAEKLSKDYIKESLPEQLANDFEDLEDASIQSLRKIVAEIEKMKGKLIGGETVKTLFDATKLDEGQFKAELDLLVKTESIEMFLDNIDKVKASVAELEQQPIDIRPSDTDIAKFKLLVQLLEQLGVNLKIAGEEVSRSGFQKIAKSAKELQGEVEGLYDSIIDLSEAFGNELSESAKKSLESVKQAATGMFNIIQAAAKLAEEGLSDVEKASAILMIITSIIKVANGIASAIKASNEESEALEQGFLDIAYRYNKALKERNLLLEQAKTIFGTDEYGAAVSQLVMMDQAQKDVAASLEKIRDLETQTGTAWWGGLSGWANLWGGWLFGAGDKIDQAAKQYENILKRWPDLIKDGVLNLDLAKSIVEDANSGLSEEAKQTLQEGIDATERYKESLKSFNDYLTSIFGDLGNNLMTAITDNLDSTMNALDNFTEYASSSLEKLFSDLAYTMYLAPIFTDLQKKINEIYTDAIPDDANQILDVFSQFGPMIATAMGGASDFLKTMQAEAAKYGFNIYGGASSASDGIRSEIKGVTEDTARRLEGLLNTVRETGVINKGTLLRIADSNERVSAYAAQSLTHLSNIDMNTKAQLDLLTSLVTKAGTQGAGLKVYVG